MLEGCWNRISNMRVHDIATDQSRSVASWRICFDRNGRGNQTITLTDGRQCRGPLDARFAGARVQMEAARCTGSFNFVRGTQDCTRLSDAEATCIGRDLEGPNAGRGESESRFRR